jgi:cytochrome P450
LRLYPLVPFNVRVALRDTSLPRGGGASGELPIVVLKDTMIAYSTLALHRRGNHSEEFLPERWFGKSPLPWTYIPFNGGPRTCVGQQFALAEMGYTVTRILQEFDRIENYMSSEPNMKAEIVLQPLHGVRIGLWRRQNLAEVSSD